MADTRVLIDTRRFDSVVFDMDGVVTETTAAHKSAWKAMFDGFLSRRSMPPFDIGEDYIRYVDGKPRYDGVRSFLASRGITLPEGRPDDPPSAETVCGLGNRKNERFLEGLASGVRAYPSTVTLIKGLQKARIRTALITSSRNASLVLEAAGIEGLFEVVIDGEVAAFRGLPGKPDPAVFLAAANDLGVAAGRTVVVEDAIAGVAAGAAGGFGFVIGVARDGNEADLLAAGAHVAVRDLSEVALEP
jgi:alpha,alpha-trehalase